MNYLAKPDNDRLKIFHEGKKRRVFVGELIYHPKKNRYELIYDQHYAESRSAIPLGPSLTLFKLRHQSKKGELFPSLLDRIPDKANPAYEDYCLSQGISPTEKNPIILLGSIGRRGPSSFIFEPVYHAEFQANDIIHFRNQLQITQHDLAKAFDISQTTLQRIEAGTSKEVHTLKYLQILLLFPAVALWQLKQTGNRVHRKVLSKLTHYFQSTTHEL